MGLAYPGLPSVCGDEIFPLKLFLIWVSFPSKIPMQVLFCFLSDTCDCFNEPACTSAEFTTFCSLISLSLTCMKLSIKKNLEEIAGDAYQFSSMIFKSEDCFWAQNTNLLHLNNLECYTFGVYQRPLQVLSFYSLSIRILHTSAEGPLPQ